MNTFLELADQLGLTPHGRQAIEERSRVTISAEGDAMAFVRSVFELALKFINASNRREFLDGITGIIEALPLAD